MRLRGGFSIAELILAAAIIAVSILTVLVLLISVSRGSRKAVDTTTAQLAAGQVLEKILERAHVTDRPNFWNNEHTPYVLGNLTVGQTEYNYAVDATTVRDASAANVGQVSLGSGQNRLKLVTVTVRWWDSASGNRAGMGKLETRATRVVSEKP